MTTDAPETKEVAKVKDPTAGTRTTSGQLQRLNPSSFGELEHMAQVLAKSDIVPKELIGKPANILLVLMFGNEIGLSAAQSLQNVMVVNGRPSLWGDAVLGLCISSSVYEDSKDEFDEKTMTAIFRAKRRGKDWVVRTFSQADAVLAGLWKKAGPWTQYPKRMLFHRARSWALRDTFPDVLKGLRYFEEDRDIVETTATRAEPVYDAPKSTDEKVEDKGPAAQAPAQAPAEVKPVEAPAAEKKVEAKKTQEARFHVRSAATTDYNGDPDHWAIRSEPEGVKYVTSNEVFFKAAKAAAEAKMEVAAEFEERMSGKSVIRWLIDLKVAR